MVGFNVGFFDDFLQDVCGFYYNCGVCVVICSVGGCMLVVEVGIKNDYFVFEVCIGDFGNDIVFYVIVWVVIVGFQVEVEFYRDILL